MPLATEDDTCGSLCLWHKSTKNMYIFKDHVTIPSPNRAHSALCNRFCSWQILHLIMFAEAILSTFGETRFLSLISPRKVCLVVRRVGNQETSHLWEEKWWSSIPALGITLAFWMFGSYPERQAISKWALIQEKWGRGIERKEAQCPLLGHPSCAKWDRREENRSETKPGTSDKQIRSCWNPERMVYPFTSPVKGHLFGK